MVGIIQISLNRCRHAHDLLQNKLAETGAGVVIMSEPNKNIVQGQNDYYCEERGVAAIQVTGGEVSVRSWGRVPRSVYVELHDAVIYSCYVSPRVGLEEFSQILGAMDGQIRWWKKPVLVRGDFNAKARLWGSGTSDRKGEILMEFIFSVGMAVGNEGNTPTFRRGTRTSVVDVTLCTINGLAKVGRWMVEGEGESGSDHNYITYEWNREMPEKRELRQEGWIIRENLFDKFLKEYVERRKRKKQSVECIMEAMIEACNCTFPKKENRMGRKRSAYWWNSETAKTRKECINKRRILTRSRKRRDGATIEQAENTRRQEINLRRKF